MEYREEAVQTWLMSQAQQPQMTDDNVEAIWITTKEACKLDIDLLSVVYEIDPGGAVAVASEDCRPCSDRLGFDEGTPQDLGDVASSAASGYRGQSSNRLEHCEITPQDTIRPVLQERGAKIGDKVIELCDTSQVQQVLATDDSAGGRLKQHEETPRDAIQPARCVNFVQSEDDVNEWDAAACKLDQDANAKTAAAKDISRKS